MPPRPTVKALRRPPGGSEEKYVQDAGCGIPRIYLLGTWVNRHAEVGLPRRPRLLPCHFRLAASCGEPEASPFIFIARHRPSFPTKKGERGEKLSPLKLCVVARSRR